MTIRTGPVDHADIHEPTALDFARALNARSGILLNSSNEADSRSLTLEAAHATNRAWAAQDIDRSILALDIDKDDNAAAFADSFARRCSAAGLQPVVVASGSPGGRHLLVRVSCGLTKAELADRARLRDPLSVRSAIRPPLSPHRCLPLRSQPLGLSAAEALAALQPALTCPEHEDACWAIHDSVSIPTHYIDLLPMPEMPKGTRYGLAALDSTLCYLASAVPGSRNNTLNTSAFLMGQLVGGGELDEHHARRVLTDVANRLGLGSAEIAKTIASGLASGRRLARMSSHRVAAVEAMAALQILTPPKRVKAVWALLAAAVAGGHFEVHADSSVSLLVDMSVRHLARVGRVHRKVAHELLRWLRDDLGVLDQAAPSKGRMSTSYWVRPVHMWNLKARAVTGTHQQTTPYIEDPTTESRSDEGAPAAAALVTLADDPRVDPGHDYWIWAGEARRVAYAVLLLGEMPMTARAVAENLELKQTRSAFTQLTKLASDGLAEEHDDGTWSALARDLDELALERGATGRAERREAQIDREQANWARITAGAPWLRSGRVGLGPVATPAAFEDLSADEYEALLDRTMKWEASTRAA